MAYPTVFYPTSFKPIITSGIGPRTYTVNSKTYSTMHRGYDLAMPIGTSLRPSKDIGGIVHNRTDIFTNGKLDGLGNYVYLQHDDGSGTVYGHLSKYGLKDGSRFNKDSVVGYSGMSGRATGPHVHWEEHYKYGLWSTYHYFYMILRNSISPNLVKPATVISNTLVSNPVMDTTTSISTSTPTATTASVPAVEAQPVVTVIQPVPTTIIDQKTLSDHIGTAAAYSATAVFISTQIMIIFSAAFPHISFNVILAIGGLLTITVNLILVYFKKRGINVETV